MTISFFFQEESVKSCVYSPSYICTADTEKYIYVCLNIYSNAFKHRRQPNIAMPMYLTSCETNAHMEIRLRVNCFV